MFYKIITGAIALEDFEQWLYADKVVEKHLKPDDYHDLISLNFKGRGAKYELRDLLMKHIDHGKFETYKMLGLLKEAKQKTARLPYILMEFYDLYCKGYYFLQDLGIGIGISVVVPSANNEPADTWNELTRVQQKELLESFFPELDECIDRVINWLKAKKIILTGEQDEFGHYLFEDYRKEKERKSKLCLTDLDVELRRFAAKENEVWWKSSVKKWWTFWK